MARLIKFYRPQGFVPASPTFRPNGRAKVIVFPTAKPKKPGLKRLVLPL